MAAGSSIIRGWFPQRCSMCEGTGKRSTIHLLVIDDDTELCDLLAEYLEPDGFRIEAVHDAEEGLVRSLSGEHALIVLDVMLPGFSGFELLRRLRARSNKPVLMLTGRADPVDRVAGLESGADDYLPKPFDAHELVARIHAILRRTREPIDRTGKALRNPRQVVGDIELDIGARTVLRAGAPVELTSVEFSLLEVLLREAGQVLPRAKLCSTVLGRNLTPFDRSIDVHVSSLRKKLGRTTGQQERIKAVRGLGYVYTLPTESLDGRETARTT